MLHFTKDYGLVNQSYNLNIAWRKLFKQQHGLENSLRISGAGAPIGLLSFSHANIATVHIRYILRVELTRSDGI